MGSHVGSRVVRGSEGHWWLHRGIVGRVMCMCACMCACACGVVGGSGWLSLGGWGLWVWLWLSGCLGGTGGVWWWLWLWWSGSGLVALGRHWVGVSGRAVWVWWWGSGLGLWVWSGGLVLGGFWAGSHRVAKVHSQAQAGLLHAHTPLGQDSVEHSPHESVT